MDFLKGPRGALITYGALLAVCAGWILATMLASPSEQASAIFLGLSLPRLVLALGLLLAFIFFFALAFYALKNPHPAETFATRWFGGTGPSRGLAWLAGISFGVSWIGCFIPLQNLGTLAEYWARVQPALVFILIASLGTLILFYRMQVKLLDITALKPGLLIFLSGAVILGFMFFSGFGVTAPQEDFWVATGVPLLVTQLWLCLLAGGLFMLFESRWNSKRAELFICLLLLGVTAFLWAGAPLQKSFMFTGAYPPNHEFYPFADSTNFDVGSQFALIGQKITFYSTLFFERPVYLGWLVYLHAFFGQNFETLMAVQAGLFGILPVLIYLIGKAMGMRAVGFAAALAIMLRGLNSIAGSNMFDTANPKMILTDFPTAIGVALITLLVCEWLREPNKKTAYLVWIGGAIGFTLMLRTNALLLFAFLPFYALLIFKPHKWKPWLMACVLMFLGLLAITIPWELRNKANGGTMYAPIVSKFENVIRQRYPTLFGPESSLPSEQTLTSATLLSTEVIAHLYQGTEPIQQHSRPCDSIACFTVNHFLHNMLTSLLSLPTSPMLNDLRQLVREVQPFWKTDWDGTLQGWEPYLILLNLFFIATGIGVTWREKRWVGITPLVIFMVYMLSNSLARTSGGRYIVPADWVLLFYYLLGIFYTLTWLVNATGKHWSILSSPAIESSKPVTSSPYKELRAIFTLLLLGGLLPLAETLYLPRYQNIDPLETLAANRALIETAGLKLHDLDSFLQTPKAQILVGRALYPRFYKMSQGEFEGVFYPFTVMDFPRTAFKLIGPAGEQSVMLPGKQPEYFQSASDVLVLGCAGPDYVDALVVIFLEKNNTILTRHPEAPLQCPLPLPVCDNNSACQ